MTALSKKGSEEGERKERERKSSCVTALSKEWVPRRREKGKGEEGGGRREGGELLQKGENRGEGRQKGTDKKRQQREKSVFN